MSFYSVFRTETFNHDTYAYSNYIGDALDSRLEFAFKYILQYSNSLFEFNLYVWFIKLALLISIFYLDSNFKLKYFWIYYVMLYQLMFDYTIVRYSVAVLVFIYGNTLLDRKFNYLGGAVSSFASFFHYSFLPTLLMNFGKIKVKNYLVVGSAIFILFFLIYKFYLPDFSIVFQYLEGKVNDETDSNLKIYKTILDFFFMVCFAYQSHFGRAWFSMLFFGIFSILDVYMPGFGFNRIRIIFEILIVLIYTRSLKNLNPRRFSVLIFILYLIGRFVLSIYDFNGSSYLEE